MKINSQRSVNSLKERKRALSLAYSVQFTRAFILCAQYLSSGRPCRYTVLQTRPNLSLSFQIQGSVHSTIIQFNLSFSCWNSDTRKAWYYIAGYVMPSFRLKVIAAAASPVIALSYCLFTCGIYYSLYLSSLFAFFCLLFVFLSRM